ncbi:MAG: hypothetical protein PHY02_10075 [Phycisphaerae bacterium]|nr:hypothetical protein [Phycisphaerae bacterium]
MKRLFIILLVVMISMASCVIKEKEMAKESRSSAFQPEPLGDDWSRSLVGEWEGSGESNAGEGKGRTKIELGLNGQFLIMKGEAEIAEITPEQRQYLKETMHATDEDIAKFQGSTFKELQIRTIDPKTGEIVGYLFDSMRCIARGTGRREGNKEIMEWQWFAQGQGALSTRITEKVSDDKFIITEKYTMPDGSIMEDKGEMIRKK